MGYLRLPTLDPVESDPKGDITDSSDESTASVDEFLRRTDLFVGVNKESFVDYYAPLRQEADEKALLAVNIVVSDGMAHCRIRSSTLLQELTRWEKKTSPQNCRIEFFFIRQQNSNSRLSITRDLFNGLRKERSIFGRVKEHAMSFGFKIREDDIGPPRCRFRLRAKLGEQAERFGKYPCPCWKTTLTTVECVYGLRYVERSGSQNPLDEWRVRQSAIYQSYKWFTKDSSSETWLLISASQSMEKMICKRMRQTEKTKGKTPFDLHLSLVRIALSNWRWYIKSLVQRTTEQTSRIVAATVGNGTNAPTIDFRINFEDQQILKVVEDRVLDLIVIWDSILDTINELLRSWQRIKSRINYQVDLDHVANELEDCLHEVHIYQGKTKTLLKRVQGTATLLSNLLEYENGKHMQDNGHSLKILAQESRIENVHMRRLTEKATRDAAAVKAITVITILYLPTTVVAGFFSTQFVFQVQTDSGRPKLSIAENWWVYVAVSLPLTAITIAVWYSWINYPWKTWWARLVNPRSFNYREAREKGPSTRGEWIGNTSGAENPELEHCDIRMRNGSLRWPQEAISPASTTIQDAV